MYQAGVHRRAQLTLAVPHRLLDDEQVAGVALDHRHDAVRRVAQVPVRLPHAVRRPRREGGRRRQQLLLIEQPDDGSALGLREQRDLLRVDGQVQDRRHGRRIVLRGELRVALGVGQAPRGRATQRC
jgi:hypothetical protein